jgi:hypothetical protein
MSLSGSVEVLPMPKFKFHKAAFLAFALWLPFGTALATGQSPADSITAAKIKDRVYFLASDALEGRYPGSRGFQIAAGYAASQFRAAGLLAVVRSDGQSSYFQPVPIAKRTVQDSPVVVLKTPGGEHTFAEGDLKIITSEGLVGTGASVPVVFAGFGISESAAGWDDLRGLDIAGKAVLFIMGAPTKNGKPILREDLHRIYVPMNSVVRKLPAMRGAAAALVLLGDEMLKVFESLPAVPEEPQFTLDDWEPGAFRLPSLCVLSPGLSKAIFGEKELPGPAAVSEGDLPIGKLEGITLDIRIPISDEKMQTCNILGVVEGTDARLKDQFIVISAHLDHLPPTRDGRIHPGANDNASGAAALLEIAGWVASQPPRRSVLFVLFSAEEGGAMGSRYFLSHCPVKAGQIVADLNMDMIGRTEAGLEANRTQYALDSSRITPAFTRLIEEVNARTVGWPLRFEHPLNLGDSDHVFFNALGIPAVSFYTGRVPDTHEPTDTADRLDYDKAAKIARLVYQIAMELGNRDSLWD